jgi:hypothetical protein
VLRELTWHNPDKCTRAVARSGISRVSRGCKPLDGARGALASSLFSLSPKAAKKDCATALTNVLEVLTMCGGIDTLLVIVLSTEGIELRKHLIVALLHLKWGKIVNPT